MKRMYIAHTCVAVFAVLLMLLPFGVNCYFASPAEGEIDFSAVQSMSFFDLRLFQFQNPLPFFTAILSFALLGASVYRLTTVNVWFNRACALASAVAFLLTMLPLVLYGTEYFTTVAMTAAFSFLCMTVIDVCILKNILLSTPKEPTE